MSGQSSGAPSIGNGRDRVLRVASVESEELQREGEDSSEVLVNDAQRVGGRRVEITALQLSLACKASVCGVCGVCGPKDDVARLMWPDTGGCCSRKQGGIVHGVVFEGLASRKGCSKAGGDHELDSRDAEVQTIRWGKRR